MSTKINDLLSELDRYIKNTFEDKEVFGLVYGSYPNKTAKKGSDVDLFIAVHSYTANKLKFLKKFIIKLHRDFGLSLDNEVPYENKLMVTFEDIDEAIYLRGIKYTKNKLTIPKVLKNKEFLSSKEVKLRLIFNALTVPHFIIGNKNSPKYLQAKKIAEENLVLLAIDLLNNKIVKTDKLLNALLYGKDGESGEMYLGYKKTDAVVNNLRKIITRQVGNFLEKEIITDKSALDRESFECLKKAVMEKHDEK